MKESSPEADEKFIFIPFLVPASRQIKLTLQYVALDS